MQEVSGEWRPVTLFRNKIKSTQICLWFGVEEYEGLDHRRPYAYDPRTESLEDDEGFEINWRTVGVDNEDSEENNDYE